jgi:phosphate starvation-inducible PhoH-like protein
MFLTRLGSGTKMIVSGDITQIDLPAGARSGLHEVGRLFGEVHDIGITRLTESDVVRHPLVGKIVAAYERAGDG